MSSFAKLAAVLSAALLASTGAAEKAADEKNSKPESKEAAAKKSKRDKRKDKDANDPNAADKPIDLPMPNGRDAKGIKIPYRDSEGKLKMRFDIGVAKKVDDTHVEMSELQIQTYDENEEPDMTIDLPTSTLDLKTSVITAHHPVTIKREDFELHGNTMIFNTKTKQGGLGGKVRMLIYNLDFDTPPTPAKPEPNSK